MRGMKRAALISLLIVGVAGLTSLAASASARATFSELRRDRAGAAFGSVGGQPPRRATQKPAPKPAAPRTIDVTVREGTSMSIAISPDGGTIATDMQGSIWTMPASGGAMTRISDVFNDARQPRWSPDGRSIVFFAYRDGGYDIWQIDKDGSNQKKLTWGTFDDREPIWSN